MVGLRRSASRSERFPRILYRMILVRDPTEAFPDRRHTQFPLGSLKYSSYSYQVLPSRPSHLAGAGARKPKDIGRELHFFGEAPERRPWAIKREDRPAFLPDAPIYFWDAGRPYTSRYHPGHFGGSWKYCEK